MIPTNNGIIYSPKHYSEYVRPVTVGGHETEDGPGVWVLRDVAQWNLLWLSYPRIDLYMEAGLTSKEILDGWDHAYCGAVKSLATAKLESQLPGLRPALIKHPKELWPIIQALPKLKEPLGQAWLDTVKERIESIIGKIDNTRPSKAKPTFGGTFPPPAMGGVIHVDFASRQRRQP